MADSTGKRRCVICEKKSSTQCEGCLQSFCQTHFHVHCEDLNRQLEEIEIRRDVFRQNVNERINDPEKLVLIQRIERWKRQAIDVIEKTANECKKTVQEHAKEHYKLIEWKLTGLTKQLKDIRQENDFNEIELKELKERFEEIEKELESMKNISLREDSIGFIDRISVVIGGSERKINSNAQWKRDGVTMAGGNGRGCGLNQFSWPRGIFSDESNECFYIVDSENHRVIQWKYDEKIGQIVAGGNGAGNRMNQLKDPRSVIVDRKTNSLLITDRGNRRVVRWPCQNGINGELLLSNIDCYDLTMDNQGYLYISDDILHEVRLWKIGEKQGRIVAGGNGQGNELNQLHTPTYIFVDAHQTIFISDWDNHRVMKWIKGAKEGMIVAGGQNEGTALTRLSHPQMLTVDYLGNIYVVDSWNHRVVRWMKDSKQGIVIAGGNGQGYQANQLNGPIGLTFDREGNLYVVDHWNNRIQKFAIDF